MTSQVPPTSVFTPYRAGLPQMRPYLSSLWDRRRFAYEMARSGRRARHVDTLFGQMWNLLNPILLAFVYWILIFILKGGSSGGFDRFVGLISGLFAFFYSREAMSAGAGSVVGGGGLLLNSAFPRLLLPLSALFNAMLSHRAQLFVLGTLLVVFGFPIGLHTLWLIPILVVQTAISAGLMLFLAVLTVYFRDTSSLLAYVLRIWLYLSPVLYHPSDVPGGASVWMHLNPLFDILAAWQRVVVDGVSPTSTELAISVAWAVIALVVGTLLFLTKEREFAVRL